jgi:hypothetical protein
MATQRRSQIMQERKWRGEQEAKIEALEKRVKVLEEFATRTMAGTRRLYDAMVAEI